MSDDDDLISFCSDMAYDSERRADDSEALRSCLLRTETARQKAADESCTLRERVRELEAYIQAMVEKAADARLDGYRELGVKVAAAEQVRDEALAALASERSRREKAEAQRDTYRRAITAADSYANGRWDEWGERALEVQDILMQALSTTEDPKP